MDLIGRFTLGATWHRATPAQQQEYQKLFALWTTNSYARRLGASKGSSVTIIGVQVFADADALVQTKIVQPDGTSVELGLRVRGAEEQMKIITLWSGA